jgi:hypothetical protein
MIQGWQYEERIAELEANDVARTQWTYDFVDGMARSAGMLIQWRCEQAESHAADCKRLVTACENDIDAERMKRREAEAELDVLDVKYVTVQHELEQALSGHGHELLIEAGIVQQRRAEQAEAELAALIPVAGACPECGIDPAELAALEAENERLNKAIDTESLTLQRIINEQGAELAALKARRCETCEHWRAFIDMGLGVGDCAATKRFCITNQLHSPATFSCSWWWAERGTE